MTGMRAATCGRAPDRRPCGRDHACGGIGLRLYYKPLVLLIWLGAVVMALGGAVSLTDRRMRIGAPARAKVKSVPAGMAPAE